MLFMGMTLLVYSGPCYVQKTTIYSYEVLCWEATIGPDGYHHCPTTMNRFTNSKGKEYSCRLGEVSNELGVSISENQKTGKMEWGTSSKSCYTYKVCKPTKPYPMALPLLQNYFFDCSVESKRDSEKKHSSTEPVGMNCSCP